MRKAIAVVLGSAILLAGASPVDAARGQRVDGTVYAPTPVPYEGCGGYVHAVLNTSVRAGFVMGYQFDVDPATWGRRFVLSSESEFADLDIKFRGATDQTYATRTRSGELGVVPIGATDAMICLNSGAAAKFVYLAGR